MSSKKPSHSDFNLSFPAEGVIVINRLPRQETTWELACRQLWNYEGGLLQVFLAASVYLIAIMAGGAFKGAPTHTLYFSVSVVFFALGTLLTFPGFFLGLLGVKVHSRRHRRGLLLGMGMVGANYIEPDDLLGRVSHSDVGERIDIRQHNPIYAYELDNIYHLHGSDDLSPSPTLQNYSHDPSEPLGM